MQGLGILAAMSLSLMLLLVDDADGAVGVEWDEVRRSVTPHQVTPRTHPVEDGRATAIIAVPEDPRYQTAAEALQRSIQQQTGVQVPLVSAAELVTGPAFAFKPNASHLILLGDLTSNPAIARLYMDYVAFEDAAYPGQGGHTVRSVVDPLGLGWNAVILGGQGPDEVAAAVDEYVGLIDARDGEAYSEYCLRVTLGEHPFLAEMQRRTDAAREWLGGWDTDLLPPGSEEYKAKNPGKTPVQYVFVLLDRHLVYDGLHYGITGEREFAEAAGRAIDALYENLEWVEAHRKAPYDAHYMVEIWLRAWQQVANCPYLTSGQRDRGHAVMGFLAGQMAAYRPDHQAYGVTSYRILSRHQYSGIFGGDALCGWAQRHCELGPELSDSIALTRERFGIVIDAMTQTYTTGFDHKWGFDGNWHLLQAAVEGPRTEHITTGLARLNADFATMCINNAGEFVNFGAENIAATEAYDAYQILGRTETLLRDGRYQWWLDERMKRHPYKIFIMSINWLGHWYHTSVPAREPTHLIGINRILAPAPLHEDLIKGRGRTHGGNPVVNDVPLGETFNKISFRDGLGEDDQYLLLDGLGGTTYSGNDANGISEYSRYGERLLVQLTPKHEPFYQNTVSVSRGNAGDPAGTFARLVEMADIGPLAYTKSVVDPLTGCGNTRHVFMEKGRHVVLFDDVALHQDGEHSIACTFRGLGEPEVDRANGTWRLRGAKADLFLQNVSAPGSPAPRLDGSVRDVGGSFGGTAFDVQVLRETVAGEFSTDETYRFANLFYGHQPDEEPARKAVPLGRDAIAVRGDETVVYGAPLEGTTRKGGLSITAAAFRLARESVQFVRLKNIEFDGEPVIDFREPVTLSVDLANETCTWQASDSECTETIVWEPTWRMTSTLAQVGAGIELPTGETVRLRAQAFLRGVEAVMAVADQAQPARPTEPPPATLPLVASARELLPPEAPISDLTFADLDGDGVDEIICAREDGHLVAARADGTRALDIATDGHPMLSVWAGALNGEMTIICGARGGAVRCYSADGAPIWEHQNTHWGYGAKPAVYSIAVGDFRGDGEQQVALGCHGGVTLLDVADGPEFARFTEVYAHVIRPMSAVSIHDGAAQWLAVNSSGGSLKLVSPAGGTVVDGWTSIWGGRAYHQDIHSFGGDDTYFVHGGFTGIGCGKLLREPWTEGQRQSAQVWKEGAWYARTDGETRAVLVRDFGGDGVPEILTGNETGFLVRYDHLGERLSTQLVGTPINGLVWADVAGEGRLVVAGDSPGLTVLNSDGDVMGRWSPTDAAPVNSVRAAADGLHVTTRDGAILSVTFTAR